MHIYTCTYICTCTVYPWVVYVQVVSIHPSEGCVLPGKSCVCRVTFYSQFSPSVYDLDIICKVRTYVCTCIYVYALSFVYTYMYVLHTHTHTHQVVDKDRMSEYQCKLVQWTKQQEENKHMFTISHPKPAQNFNTDEVCVCVQHYIIHIHNTHTCTCTCMCIIHVSILKSGHPSVSYFFMYG